MIGSPTTAVNARNNHRAPVDRATRWRSVRDELWTILDPRVAPGARVAIVGAGNADDLPLTRLAARAGEIALVDIDGDAARRAVRREPRRLRGRIAVVDEDVTDGAADRIVAAALRGIEPDPPMLAPRPLANGGHDVVVGDLLYSQLLYPALAQAGVPGEVRARVLRAQGQALTQAVVAKLQRSAGAVVHLHDVAGWWAGHPQPATLRAVLWDRRGPAAAARVLRGPRGCDLPAAVAAVGATVEAERWWHWPFAPGVSYLVQALVCAPVMDVMRTEPRVMTGPWCS